MPEGKHEAIHEFRKSLKRLRSLYRLVAAEIPELSRRECARLRDVAKSLSAMRDAAALLETTRYLKQKARSADEAEALGRIVSALECRRNHMAEAEADIDRRLADAPGVLKSAVATLEDIDFHRGHRRHARLVAKGWRKAARKAKEAIARCRAEGSAEAYHALRKRTQDYRAYHILLRPLWPAAMEAKYEVTSSLIDLLGHIHDLDVLCELVEAEPRHFPNADDLAHLLDCIIVRQLEDRRAALMHADEVFGDDPDEEASRIEVLFTAIASRG